MWQDRKYVFLIYNHQVKHCVKHSPFNNPHQCFTKHQIHKSNKSYTEKKLENVPSSLGSKYHHLPGKGEKLTLFIYSDSRSCSACRTALHSCTMRSRRSSRVQDESAISAAPLMMLSSRSSSEGRERTSLNDSGSMIIFCCKFNM